MRLALIYIEKYGLLAVLLFGFQLLSPDLSSKAVLMDRDLTAYTEEIGGADIVKQLFWVGFAFVYGLCLLNRGVSRVSKPLFFIMISFAVLLLILSISLAWSEFASHTIKRVVFQVLFAFVVFTSTYLSLMRSTFSRNVRIVVAYSILIGLVALAISGWDSNRGFSGWAATKNAFGGYILALMLFLLFASSCDFRLKSSLRKIDMLFMFCLFMLLVLSISKTSIMLGVLVLVFFYLNKPVLKVTCGVIVALLVTTFVLAPGLSVLVGYEWNIATLMSDETLTGRGYIWRVLYSDLMDNEKFLIGYGYGAYFGVGEVPLYLDDPWSYIRFLNSAHNSYVELMLQLGWFFSFLIICILIAIVYRIDCKPAYLCLLTVAIHGVTESSLLRDAHVMWLVYISSISLALYERNYVVRR